MRRILGTNSIRAPRAALALRESRSSLPCPQLRTERSTSERRTSSRYLACPNRSPPIATLHALVIRTAAALGWDPINNLVRIGDVASLAVHAIRKIDLQPPPAFFLHHFVD